MTKAPTMLRTMRGAMTDDEVCVYARTGSRVLNALARLCVCKHIYALRNGTKSRALDGNGSACHSWIHKHVALLYIHATGAANNLLVA